MLLVNTKLSNLCNLLNKLILKTARLIKIEMFSIGLSEISNKIAIKLLMSYANEMLTSFLPVSST